MEDSYKIQITWKKSERGKVCYASAISKNGKVLAEEHITLPTEITLDYYKTFGNLGDEEIEKAARYQVKFKMNNPDLFK